MQILNSNKAKRFFCAFTSLLLTFAFVTASADYTASRGLNAVKPDAVYTICGIKDRVVSLSAEIIEKRLGLQSGTLAGIILTELPSKTSGKLTVAGQDAVIYETINRSGLDRLAFTPKKNCSNSSFCFIPLIPNKEDSSAQMSIALLDKPNTAPVAAADTISTLKNVNISGYFKVSDNDSSIKIRIVDKPEKGEVIANGLSYTYEPFLDMTGSDSFTYQAIDPYGYTSATVKINVKIEKPQTSICFADMNGDTNAYAVLKLAERGVVLGEKIGQNYYFKPQEKITKADFLLMLLAVTNEGSNLPATVNTGLKNDTSIPLWLKPAVAKAEQTGIIGGKVCKDSFDYNSTITHTEAAYMIQNAVQFPDTAMSNPNFEDAGSIPTWALQSFVNLYSNNIIKLDAGNAEPNNTLTRSDAAGMLWQVLDYCDENGSNMELS